MNEFVTYIKPIAPTVIVEIGSLNAVDALFFKNNFPDARVIAIEGSPSNYKKHFQNITEIEVYQMVINSYDGDTIFHEKHQGGLNGILNRGDIYGNITLNLKCQRFDTFCTEHNIVNVDALKIDVEGATLEVLTSFGDILSTVKVMHIETEDGELFLGQKLQRDVCLYLKERGFVPLRISGTHIQDGKSQYDEVWVSSDYIKLTNIN